MLLGDNLILGTIKILKQTDIAKTHLQSGLFYPHMNFSVNLIDFPNIYGIMVYIAAMVYNGCNYICVHFMYKSHWYFKTFLKKWGMKGWVYKYKRDGVKYITENFYKSAIC